MVATKVPKSWYDLMHGLAANGAGKNGNGPVANERLLSLALNSTLLSRQHLLTSLLDPRRDIGHECGYPDRSVNPETFQQLYEREAVATRVVQVMARECWQVQPQVFEVEEEEITPFEEAWDALGGQLRSKGSRFRDEEGSPVWDYLSRLDRMCGIGQYAILLLGIDDGKELREPADGVEEMNSAPATRNADGTVSYPQGQWAGRVYGLATNAAKNPSRKLLYLRVFPESLADITQYESNPTSPRFMQPVMYSVTFNDPRTEHGGIGLTTATVDVHWTRVIHVADNLESSEVFGVPRMRPVLNRLLDLAKLYGGSAEMYWRGAFPGLSLETTPQLGGDVEVDIEGTRDFMEDYMNGLQRYLLLMGMQAKTLSPTVVDPTPQINVQIEAICIQLGIPKRIFMGSERGELASTQDDQAWNDRLRERQNNYITPRVIIPFVDRLIALGVLPEPESYSVWWPDLTSQSDAEKADVAMKLTTAIVQYVSGGGESVMPPRDFLVRILGLTDEEAEAILTAAAEAAEQGMEGGGSDSPSPLLSLVGGISAMIELYKAAKEGALSEDQLKQIIITFFKVSEDEADRLIADGLPEPEPPPAPPALPGGAPPGAGGKPFPPAAAAAAAEEGDEEQPAANVLRWKTANAELSGGRWVTTEGGSRVYIKDGEAVAGNPHVVQEIEKPGAGKGESPAPAKAISPEEVKQLHKDLASKMPELPEDQFDALDTYTSGAYEGINKQLRTGELALKGARAIPVIEKAIDSAPTLKEPIAVYRGLRLDAEQGEKFLAEAEAAVKSGGVMEDKGFSSTTIDPGIAKTWATGGKGAQTPIVMEISARKGLYLGESAGGSKEKEFLLQRSTKMRVLGVEDRGTHKVIRMEQVL